MGIFKAHPDRLHLQGKDVPIRLLKIGLVGRIKQWTAKFAEVEREPYYRELLGEGDHSNRLGKIIEHQLWKIDHRNKHLREMKVLQTVLRAHLNLTIHGAE